MKATDFRIGNFLHDRENRLCKVEEIYTNEVKAPAINGGITSLPNKPIPITKEWLLSFGFKYSEKMFEYCLWDGRRKSCIIQRCGNRDENKWLSNNAQILYIHQIQNIYNALTGLELHRSEGALTCT